MSKKWLALVAMTALIGGVASVGCSSDDADNNKNDKGNNAGAGGEAGNEDDDDDVDGGDGGSGGSGGGGGGPQGCGSLEISSDPTCNTCMEDECCDELAACDEGSECEQFLDCLDACPSMDDQACVMACIDEFPDGADAQDALRVCFQGSCQNECTQSDICGSGQGYEQQSCNVCLTDNCCDVIDPCFADPECASCFGPAGKDCHENELYTAYRECRLENCNSNTGCAGPTQICTSGIGFTQDNATTRACAECLSANCCEIWDDGAANKLVVACITGAKEGAECDDVKDIIDAINECEADNCAAKCPQG